MSKASRKEIRSLCHKRIVASRGTNQENLQFEDQVVRVIDENISSGRFGRLVSARAKGYPLTLAQYVDNVIDCLSRESARLHALERGDPDEWNRLRDLLYQRAVRMVRRFRPGGPVEEAASDFAQQTCLVIFEKRYPFDVPFEAWATTILNNQILARYTRSPDPLNRPHALDSLDASPVFSKSASSLGEFLQDPRSRAPFEKVENQTELLDAIDQLSSKAQREVIMATFFEELSDAQIAKRLKKSRQAIYNLRERALKRLLVLLGEEHHVKESGVRLHQKGRGVSYER